MNSYEECSYVCVDVLFYFVSDAKSMYTRIVDIND